MRNSTASRGSRVPRVPRVSAIASAISPSATLAVDAKTKKLRAAGENVIGFGAGEPDFPTPPHIVEAAAEACRDPRNHRYSPTAGQPELREALAAKTLRDSGLDLSPGQFLVTNGGKQAVYTTMAVLLDPGDEVLLPAPYWTSYPEAVRIFGGVPVEVFAGVEAGFRVSVEQLEAARTGRTKALMFVSPSNPTGVVYDRAEIEAIGRWAVEHGVWVITDEIYEHLVYGADGGGGGGGAGGGSARYSLPVVVPEAAERCVVLNGVAKTYAMTGWRVGWMAGPDDVIAAATNLQSHLSSNVCNVAQAATLAAVSGPLDAVAEMRAAFDERRHVIVRILDGIDGVRCALPDGAFYAFPSLEGVLDGGAAGGGAAAGAGGRPGTTLDLAATVLDEARVAFVPGEAFGAPGYGRFSFALGMEDLVEGATRLAELLGKLHADLPG
ncbi:MAG TPA: aspartate aminotransferase [Acidimicrobiaceae bacterium]|nr:aspartate aminotransferase [Acidimicrobiaceae bacterium]HCB37146.1 aspartate aminotransferase [Acidimicrobiaceae bacterium]